MTTTADIARILRTTEDNAARFVERVHAEVGEPIGEDVLVEIIRGINPRQLSLPKVVHAVRDYHKRLAARAARRSARRPSKAVAETATLASTEPGEVVVEEQPVNAQTVAAVRPRSSSSLVARISDVLERNWTRAKREGFSPDRLDPEAFIDSVRDYTDPRDATHARILAAVQELDRSDVLITPTVTADRVRELAY